NMYSNKLYASKEYNRCEKHKKKKCRCDYNNVEHVCNVCDEECPVRTMTRFLGPFEYGNFRELGDNRRLKRIRDDDITFKELILNPKDMPTTWFQNAKGALMIENARKKYLKLDRGHRFWHPLVFYFYGPGGSGKTGLVQELFGEEYYEKSKKMRSGSSWWNDYEGEDIVFLDEFYMKIE
ncbi:17854_t:CDS:2, partial [Cetraspora pellucida]